MKKQATIIEQNKPNISDIPSFKNALKDSLKQYYENTKDAHRKIDGYLSVSQFSGNACQRKAYYQLTNAEKNSDNFNFESQIILNMGTLIHEYLQEALSQSCHLADIEKFIQDDELKICGSIDGIFVSDDKKILIDFKSCGLNTFEYVKKSGKATKSHLHQLHVYAMILNKYYGYNITQMKVIYINKNHGANTPYTKHIKDNLINTLDYLNDVSQKYISSGRESMELLSNIYSLESAINSLEEISTVDKNEDYLIEEVDIVYDEKIPEEEINKAKILHELVETNKDKKKPKLPNKISKPYICATCHYRGICRGLE